MMIKGTTFTGHQRNTSAGQQLIVASGGNGADSGDDEEHIIQCSYGAASPSHPMPNFTDYPIVTTQNSAAPMITSSSSDIVTLAPNANCNNGGEQKCCENPKLRENAKVVIGSVLLTLVGAILLIVGIVITILPDQIDMHGWVFLFAGFLFFTPGIYHVVYILCTISGRPGYTFDNLPTFSK